MASTSTKFNEATKERLSNELKHLRERCIDSYNRIENSCPEQNISSGNVGQIALSYVEGLQTALKNSETIIPTDENLIISQFFVEMKAKNEEVEKLTAFTRGTILDVNNEIERLETRITEVQKANEAQVESLDVSQESIDSAKNDFSVLREELKRLMQSIFKDDSQLVSEITGQLMQERLNPESNGYIEVTKDVFHIVEVLKDMKIVSENPYNDKEVKLAY